MLKKIQYPIAPFLITFLITFCFDKKNEDSETLINTEDSESSSKLATRIELAYQTLKPSIYLCFADFSRLLLITK